ncbi:MAG: hypothetical protein U0U09_00075 [Cyclobacteriaceae bacterium]|mgnify:CR=1 FL=1
MLTSPIDTTKIELVSPSLDSIASNLSKPSDSSMWTILGPLLIGAALTILTQLLIELYKARVEKKKKILQLISKGRAKTYLIAQLLKDLAMYKVHKQYYWRAYEVATEAGEKDDSMKKHYEKGQEQRMTESKLDENIADYFETVTEYSVLAGELHHFSDAFEKIYHYVHPKSSKLTECTTASELVAGLEQEEKRLNGEYKEFFRLFERIQNRLT